MNKSVTFILIFLLYHGISFASTEVLPINKEWFARTPIETNIGGVSTFWLPTNLFLFKYRNLFKVEFNISGEDFKIFKELDVAINTEIQLLKKINIATSYRCSVFEFGVEKFVGYGIIFGVKIKLR